jgi:predicted nucleic acid-binding protein
VKHLFVDTATLLYATGGNHPLRQPCRALLVSAAAGAVGLHISTEAVQEYLFHRMRRVDRTAAVAQAIEVMGLCKLHPFDEAVVRRMIDVVATSEIRGRDAVHVATAQVAGFAAIVSPDTDLDRAPGLRRLSPREALTTA